MFDINNISQNDFRIVAIKSIMYLVYTINN